MIGKLADAIPYYQERLMIQPGITGWAQVNYPYGSSVADSRRKLEYDLYYMKNMSVFLDVFILLDTVRIVLCGGVNTSGSQNPARSKAMDEFRHSTSAPDASASVGEVAQGLELTSS